MENVALTVTIERCEYENLLALVTKVKELETLVKYYESQLLSAKRRLFGTSSERTEIDPQQLSLFGDGNVPPPPEFEWDAAVPARERISV